MSTWSKQIFKDSPLSIAQGEVTGHSGEHKFGAVPEMSTGTTGTVWDIDDTKYPWSSFSASGTLSIPAVNASDNGKKVTIVGLDDNYELLTEEITVSNTTAVTTANSFLRIYRAFVSEGATNVANINIQKSSVNVARITAAKGQTLMAVYTVPAGYTAYLVDLGATVEEGGDCTVDVFARVSGESQFRIKHSFELANSQYYYKFGVPLVLEEKTDVDVQATMRTNNSRATCTFDMVLVKNNVLRT